MRASLTHAQSCSLCVKPVHKPHSKMSQHKSIETPSLSIGFFHGVKCEAELVDVSALCGGPWEGPHK